MAVDDATDPAVKVKLFTSTTVTGYEPMSIPYVKGQDVTAGYSILNITGAALYVGELS